MPHDIELTPVEQCPLCGSTDRRVAYTGREHEYPDTTDLSFTFKQCGDCKLLYLDPRPAESALGVIYPPDYYSQVAENAAPDSLDLDSAKGRLVHRRMIARVGANIDPFFDLKPDHRVLDVGCGGGRMIQSLHRHYGCEVHGIDFDISQAVAARYQTPPIVLHRGNFLTHDFGTERFDVVYASHLIEHLPDPITFLRRCDDLLRPGGLCIIETPNADCWPRRKFGANWGGNHFPRHWFLLDPTTAERAAQVAADGDLEVVAVHTTASSFFWIWTFHAMLYNAGWKRLADGLFPSGNRIGQLGPVGIARHGFFTAMDVAVQKISGQAGAMSVVYKKLASAQTA